MSRVPLKLNVDEPPIQVDPETYIFNFGKHKGESFLDVLTEDANYLVWCLDELDWFTVDRSTEDAIYEEVDIQQNYSAELEFGS
jgi:hypothetical protein